MTPKTAHPKTSTCVVPDQIGWTDLRLTVHRHNQYAFAAPDVTDLAAWETRAAWVKRRVLLASGLCPMPERTPLNARVWGEFEHAGCRVAKVHFESRPGFLVTGNLYRPLDARGRFPGVLCPHGHWAEGRMGQTEHGSVPARCLDLARLGFVVFSYDMVGYNDSRQVIHRWPLEQLRRAALWGVSPFGLQTWNSLRAVDFLCGLPDVNPTRIGCTGASGGATQTWTLAAVDDRVRVVAPVCMVSSHYQGGCVCEEGPLLRLGPMTTLDVCGALAPRPALYPSVTGDWTNLNPWFEMPVLRAIYRLYDAEDRLENVHFDDAHNYNRRTAEYVYAFLLKWLAGRKDVGRRVRAVWPVRPPLDKALIFPNDKPGPVAEADTQTALDRFAAEAGVRFSAPPTTASWRRLRRDLAEPYTEVFSARQPEDAEVAVRVTYQSEKRPGWRLFGRSISRRGMGDIVPALWLVPDGTAARGPAVLAVCAGGKADLLPRGRPSPLLAALLAAGLRVLAIDLLGAGDTAAMARRVRRDTDDPLFYAFNQSLLAMRVQDVLTALAALRMYDRPGIVSVLGVGEGARPALLALPLSRGVRAAVFDLTGLRRDPDAWDGEAYHPLALQVGELKAAVALAAPMRLTLAGADSDLAAWTRAVYRAAGKPAQVRIGPSSAARFAAGCRP